MVIVRYFIGLALIMNSMTSISAQELSLGGRLFWPVVLKMVRSDFPDVSQIPTDTLSVWLQEEETENKPLLLDVRTTEEFGVSHLKEAHLTPSEKEAAPLLADVPKDRRIVVYCSVGYRSSELAAGLMKQGFTNIHNLEGSLFAWANEGRPVYRNGQAVKVVHPYGGIWGKLLKEALRWKEPE